MITRHQDIKDIPTSFDVTGPNKEFGIECTDKKSCYCYGNFCIKGYFCNAGIAVWQGKPICGQNWGSEARVLLNVFSSDDDLFCKALGFNKIVHTGFGYKERY